MGFKVKHIKKRLSFVVASVGKPFLVLIVFIVGFSGISAQENVSIEDALLSVAKDHQLNLIFNESILPVDKLIQLKQGNLKQKLEGILEGTGIKFKIEKKQILLYRTHRIYGYLFDSESGESLIGATIKATNDPNYTITNEEGYFSILVNQETVKLQVSYVGYLDTLIEYVSSQMDRPRSVYMDSNNKIDEILVTDKLIAPSESPYIELHEGSDILLYGNQASSAIGGEPDVFQAIMRQTGVTTGTDGVGGLHVRGGKSGHNLVLYDDVKLYNPNHAFGLYSTINNNMVDQARLIKGGAQGLSFGSLASILSIRTKNPNMNKVSGEIQSSSIATQASIELPIVKNKVGLLFNARRTHLDPLISKLTANAKERNNISGNSDFYFFDVNAKLKAILTPKQQLQITLFKSGDKFLDVIEDTDIAFDDLDEEYYGDSKSSSNHIWGNALASLKYKYLFGANSIVNLIASSYSYKYDSELSRSFEGEALDFEGQFYERSFSSLNSGISSNTIQLNIETKFNNHQLSYGFKGSRKIYDLGIFTLEDNSEFSPYEPLPDGEFLDFSIGIRKALSGTFYGTDSWRISPRLLVLFGGYISYFKSVDFEDLFDEFPLEDIGWQGYVKATYKINEQFHVGGSARKLLQYEHLLSPADNGYPNDVWLPSTQSIYPQQGYQGELFSSFQSGEHNFKTSFFYKYNTNQTLIDSLAPLLTLSDFLTDEWENIILTGTLVSKGGEASYSYNSKGLNLQAGYTFLVADYLFNEVNEGERFPHEFSIPHTFTIAANIQLAKKWVLGVDWYFAYGKTHTLYDSYVDYSPLGRDGEFNVDALSGYNDFRLPPQHKLSITASTTWKLGAMKNDLTIGIQNVYNRKNAIYQYESLEGRQSFTGFPLLPILKYKVSW